MLAGPSDHLCTVTTPIATVHIGFAVADGRPTVIAVESAVAAVFVVVAAVILVALIAVGVEFHH